MPPKQPPNHSERRSESTAVHQTGAAEGVTALRRRYESHHATKALVTPEPTHRKAYGRATPQVEASPEQGKGSSQNPMYRGPNTVARGGTGTFSICFIVIFGFTSTTAADRCQNTRKREPG